MKTTATAFLISLILMFGATMCVAQVINGSFESDDLNGAYYLVPGNSSLIPGWTTIDSGVEWFQPTAYSLTPAPDGVFVVDIANYTYSAGGIAQTITTDPGTVYQINFSLGTHVGSGRDGTCEIIVEADGQAQNFSMVNQTATLVWETKTFEFTADDLSADLTFRCVQNANYHFAYIDGVGTEGTVATASTVWGELKSLYR